MYLCKNFADHHADPMQQKIMQWMPVAMSVFFLWFLQVWYYTAGGNVITLVQPNDLCFNGERASAVNNTLINRLYNPPCGLFCLKRNNLCHHLILFLKSHGRST